MTDTGKNAYVETVQLFEQSDAQNNPAMPGTGEPLLMYHEQPKVGRKFDNYFPDHPTE